jgi:hypothetical protein
VSTTSTARSHAPTHDDRLQPLAQLFEALFLDLDATRDDAPHLLGVSFERDCPPDDWASNHGLDVASSVLPSEDGDVKVFMKPLDCHPSQALMGWYAPAGWWCLGVAAGGWASTYDPDAPGAPRPTQVDRRRIRMLHLVSREGETFFAANDPLTGPIRRREMGPPAGSVGLIDDCVRCALRLPTAPPPDDPTEYFALVWIDRLLRAAVAGDLQHAAWIDVASLHPAFDFVERDTELDVYSWAVDHVARAGELLVNAYPWRRLRKHALKGKGFARRYPREIVEWMDLGMFARTNLGHLPPLEDALLDLGHLVSDAVYVQLVDTIEHWGLLAAPTLLREDVDLDGDADGRDRDEDDDDQDDEDDQDLEDDPDDETDDPSPQDAVEERRVKDTEMP